MDNAQRGVAQNNRGQNSKSAKSDAKPTMVCHFYQRESCHNQRDHKTRGTLHLVISKMKLIFNLRPS